MKVRSTFSNEIFFSSKSKSISILIVSVMSSVLNSVGLTLLVPILFQSFHINFSSEINGAIKNLFKNYMHWLPGDVGPWMLLFILILFLLKNALTALRVQLVSQLTRVQLLKLRTRLLNHILSKDLHYFVKFGNGTILNHLSTNVEKSSKYFVDSIEYFGMLFQLLAYIVVLAVISWKLCLICAVFSGPLLLLNRRIAKKARILSTEQSYSQANLVQKFNDILIGIRYVKISGREHDHVSWITVQSQVILDRLARMNFLSNITSPITELSAMVLLVAMVTSLSFMGNQSLISVDSFFSYLLILGRAMPLFNGVSSKRIDIASNLGSLIELEKVLQDKLYESNFRGTQQLSKISNGLTFSNVTFSYPETTRNVLNSISFDIKRGESVAIVGPSGSGKSTLIDLLLGFYLPTSGQILVDGNDYKNYDPKNYRNKIALVPQDSVMFFSTIRENLLYLKPKATEIEIWRALDQADLAEFISNLPEGLDTNVGERGIRFSGGQRQRLAIARALLQDPEIIIFDEATSSLDSISESKIVDSIKRASIGRTTITIAHRLATILHCKKIILIEHGWLVEYGTIDELININSRFKRYAEAQNLKLSA